MSIIKDFEEQGITGLVEGQPQQKVRCPKCSDKRAKKHEPCLSVNIELGVAKCHNQGCVFFAKSLPPPTKESYVKKSHTKPNYDLSDTGLKSGDAVCEYMTSRGISEDTLIANFIGTSYFGDEPVVDFPYIKGEVVNVKHRHVSEKKFSFVGGAEICLYGIQNLFQDGYLATKKVIFCEGECDSLSLYECGFKYALSVPNGAGVEEQGYPHMTPKLPYLDDPDIAPILQQMEQIILACDADYKGERLRDELAKRLGIERCFTVDYPNGCKDMNDVLVIYGKEKVIECIQAARPMLEGIVTVESMHNDLVSYYSEGLQPGMSCGIEAFDDLYTLKEGLITLVTGVPEIKKSNLLDNIMVGYARLNDLHCAVFSPETKPTEFHVGRLASIHNGYSLDINSKNRMPYQNYKDSCVWINKHFTFLQPPHATLPEILQLAKLSVLRYGTKVVVIDPYSRIRVESEREDKFIRDMLTDLSEFAVRYGVHVFLVAHPTKTETFGRGSHATTIKNYPIITPYMIKGAAEFFNSSDFILSLWRDLTLEDSPLRVYCLKSKYYHIARSYKFCELDYDFTNWRLTSRIGRQDLMLDK